MAQALLKAVNITKSFAGVQALKGVSLEIMPGEVHCLAGENGCGKSTLIKVISGVHPRDGGTLEFNGKVMDKFSPIDAIMAGGQVIYQDFAVFPNLTVMENLEMGAYISKDKARNQKILANVFEHFPRLEERKRQLAGTLSGGEQQMLAIGRAMMANPDMLLLDEPSMGLSPLLVKEIFKIIKELNDDGITILLVEQNAKQALSIAHRGYVLETGKIVLSGNAAELLENDAVKKAYLGG
jgi:branched-chain amino acid transport system ATP-binding protein